MNFKWVKQIGKLYTKKNVSYKIWEKIEIW